MKIDFDKVKAIYKLSISTLAKKILLFLEFADFYWKFVKDYLEITILLTEMTRKNIVFI